MMTRSALEQWSRIRLTISSLPQIMTAMLAETEKSLISNPRTSSLKKLNLKLISNLVRRVWDGVREGGGCVGCVWGGGGGGGHGYRGCYVMGDSRSNYSISSYLSYRPLTAKIIVIII